ncbi:hydroxymethylglutaryl-CoA lyase [Actinomycetes bacterium]|nr:hydroxymethylglutaryl-CoA lyase [Actinomycetes bacterium]
MAGQSLTILEVCPRDGLQNERIPLAPDDRIDLINRLVGAGARRIEAVSFVNPKFVPQMAGAEEVMAGLDRGAGVSYSGLVLNRRGNERALSSGVDEVNVVVPSTDGMSRANQNIDVNGMLQVAREIIFEAHSAGVPVTGTAAVAFGCPFEGEVSVEMVRAVVRVFADAGVQEIAIADTIGVGVPAQVRILTQMVHEIAPDTPLRFHFHNTRNTGYANAAAALDEGVRVLDAAAGGFGGCPFSPAATGNIATEDLDFLAVRSGYSTGMKRDGIVAVAQWVGELLERTPPAMVGRAGIFPPPADSE